MTEKRPIPEWVIGVSSFTLLYASLWWSFSKQVKKEVWELQDGKCGEPGCQKPIAEYHHRVPENALKRQGIRGKDVAENAVGLCFHHHKHKWDILMEEGVFYPGVSLDEIDPQTYTEGNFPRKNRPRKRRRR